nr:hypothetical protein [Xylella fastidiosa]
MILERIRISIARAREIRNLERQVAAATRARACNIHQLSYDCAIWRISVPGQADRYMSASSGYSDKETFAVHVDANAFYLAWLCSGSDKHCVLRSQMPSDYKYADAAHGFAQGSTNPVPLAEVYHGPLIKLDDRSHVWVKRKDHWSGLFTGSQSDLHFQMLLQKADDCDDSALVCFNDGPLSGGTLPTIWPAPVPFTVLLICPLMPFITPLIWLLTSPTTPLT